MTSPPVGSRGPESDAGAEGADGPTPFERAVARVLDALAEGELTTYGEVAEDAGYPGRARAVGALLARSGDCHPWWRVVTASGRLVPGHEAEQARLLRAEGHRASDGFVHRAEPGP